MSFPGNQPASNSNATQAGPRSYQSAPVAPTGPSTSSSFNTRNSKLEHIIQNFYTKAAQVVVQARLDGNTNRRSSSSNSVMAGNSSSRSNKPNKWFNIATLDVDFLREELKYWRALSIQSINEEPPPLILDIVLDVSQLTHGQILVLADDRSRLNKIDINGVETILLERWVLSLNHPLPDFPVDLPNLYKRSIVFFRALYSFVRLLPSYSLHRRLRNYGQSNGLTLNYRLTSSPTYRNDEIPLDQSILRGGGEEGGGAIDEYDFSDVVTPLGTFKLHVEYRKNCDFRAEDSERDLSARMIDMDEHFFTPTMVQHRQEQRPRSVYSYDEVSGSRYAHRNSPPHTFRRQSSDASDPREIIQQRQRQSSMGIRGSPTSISPLNRETTSSITRGSPVEASATTIGTPPSSAKRRTSAPHMSPFKSLPLSSSPQADQILTSGVRSQTSSSERSRIPGVEGASPSGRSKIEFSPSFDKIRNSPSRTETSMMTRRWSRASDHSSINFADDPELEEFIRLAAAKPDLKLAQNRASNSSQMIESANFSPTSETSSSLGASGYGSGSIYRSKKALSHYRNLRETHNTLSESLSSSVLASGERQEQHAVGTSLGSSSTSSNSRPYLPAVRSPLHSEGSINISSNPSTSPMHIPRSYHRHTGGSMGNNNSDHTGSGGHIATASTGTVITTAGHTITTSSTSAGRHRRYHSSQTAEYNKEHTSRADDVIRDDDHPAAAFSSYPQDRHHDELRRLCVLESDSPSSTLRRQESLGSLQDDVHPGLQSSSGSAIHNQGGRPSSLDDDDSLVFKMSELGGETQPSVDEATTTASQNIILHSNTSTRDYARRLGINPSNTSSSNNITTLTPTTTTTCTTTTNTIATTGLVVNDTDNSNINVASDTAVRRISSSTSIPQGSVAMATVLEEEEKSGSGSSSSISKSDSHSKYPEQDFW
ncbi:autophagy-related protein 13-domain-containing protein [Phascolomyces articulosus]|uniref:Autophagy-related protein 13 n=1 Tax=Phascolomyces articulosus TaxID=60185 RepID=A0AAD5KCE1_9FUNG|nr:autophagy-related protein 13-domain-containing protein [Phascolomyces articulosus]